MDGEWARKCRRAAAVIALLQGFIGVIVTQTTQPVAAAVAETQAAVASTSPESTEPATPSTQTVESAMSEPATAQAVATAEAVTTTQAVTATQAIATTQAATTTQAVTTTQAAETQPASRPASQPMYDTTIARPLRPKDWWERQAVKRGPDYKLVDRWVDPITPLPKVDRKPPGTLPADAVIADGVPMLSETQPFPEPNPLEPIEVSIQLAAAESAYHTRTKVEVLSALQPLIDQIQREVNIRSDITLYDNPQNMYFGLLDGREQMAISNVFDYLLLRSWFANVPDNGVIPLAWAQPANPRTGALDRDFPGVSGTSIELIVARDSRFKTFADLKGARLSLTARYIDAPGTYLTQLLSEIGHPLDQPFFGKVTLRRYTKDTMIDVYQGNADAACVDSGTVAALYRFYKIDNQLRTLAVSPRYNMDVLFTTANNVQTHGTEIELTQAQITTLGKNIEGEESLYLFDTREWHLYREGDYAVPEEFFRYFVTFMGRTPVDLKPLLDPAAHVDRHTYDRYGDE